MARDNDSHKKNGVLVDFLVLLFLVLPFFLPFRGFNTKSGFRNKLFINLLLNQAHAMDFDPTEPGRGSLNGERPGFPLSNQGDGEGLQAGPSKCIQVNSLQELLTPTRCSNSFQELLTPTTRCSKTKTFDITGMTSSFQKFENVKKKIRKEKEDTLKRLEEEKNRKSKIYTVLKPQMGEQLAKLSKRCSNISSKDAKISRVYKLPKDLPTKDWEYTAERLLGREDENAWETNLEDLRNRGIDSDFFKSAAGWWISNRECP